MKRVGAPSTPPPPCTHYCFEKRIEPFGVVPPFVRPSRPFSLRRLCFLPLALLPLPVLGLVLAAVWLEQSKCWVKEIKRHPLSAHTG